jgi:adenylyltransferase/sulfurtransferase
VDYFEFCGVPGLDHTEGPADAKWNITALHLSKRLKRGDKIRLIDVREPHELDISHIAGAENLPLGLLAARLGELDSAQEIVLFCKSGTRSARALELLMSAGFQKVKNLRGGINAWASDVDRSMPLY